MNKNMEMTISKLMKERCNKCENYNVCNGIHQYECVTNSFAHYKNYKNEEKEEIISNEDMLIEIFNIQKQLQEKTMGYNFKEMTPQQRARYIKDMMFWCNDEFSEATHELPYAKDWSKKYDKPDYNHEKQWQLFKEEIVDALHFFINICLASGITPKDLFEGYIEKNKENIDRQKRGY